MTQETQTSQEGYGYQTIDASELTEMIGKEDVVILDVRTKEEFEEGHINGAISIPVDELNPLTFKDINKEKRVVAICEHGVRSKAACKFLHKYFPHLYHVEGGMEAYREYTGEGASGTAGYAHQHDEDDHRLIKPSMMIGELVQQYPQAAEIMLSYGLHCIGCHVNPYESIEGGALGHGMSDEEFENLIGELNDMATKAVGEDMKQHEGNDGLPNSIILTPTAITKIRELLAKDNKQGYHLRVQVVPGGCSGFKYGLSFDNQKYPDDVIFEQEGFNVLIDPESMGFMKGSSIDYLDSLSGSGFKIENPKAHNTCGCGKSFG